MRWSLAVISTALLLASCREVPAPAPTPVLTSSLASSASNTAAPDVVPDPSLAEAAIPGISVSIEEKAMGTRVAFTAYTTDTLSESRVRSALYAALAEIRRIEDVMSTWISTSEVSKVNKSAGGAAVKVSQETFDVIAKSLWVSKLSEGTFDITFASMGKLWSFDEHVSTVVPDAAAVEKARKLIDYRNVKLGADEKTVQLALATTQINLGGIAKGYAIDQASRVLRDKGLSSFYCQAGGDLFVQGTKPDGAPWRVGIRDPRGPEGEYFAILEVKDHAFSTAGDYERFFLTKDNKRYHHILDPRTGYPATASRSVTIWAKDAFTADAIDNAVFILGPEKGMALVESLEGAGAVIVDAENRVFVSSRLKGKVRIMRAPTDGP